MSAARRLPAVHRLLADGRLAEAEAIQGHAAVRDAAREVLDAARAALRADAEAEPPTIPELVDAALARLADWLAPRPRPLINATGVILHTNLGRAPLSSAAAEAQRRASAGYSDLEYRLDRGKRGSRQATVAPLLCRLTGAEAALVVNNNAGATLLVLSALARGRGVIVSRGQLVEIGGGFRIPEVMAAGGARLVEVGTTNRTRIEDYRRAIDAETALILRVHASNFRLLGFTEQAGLEELVDLAREAGLPLVDDLGSGSLIDPRPFGLAAEPRVQDSIAAGADLVTFSGDKLLGGPQAGIVVGRADAVAALRRHPLARALRPGKDSLAGLQATLLHYLRGEALTEIPVWRMIATPLDTIAARAAAWQAALAARGIPALLREGESTIGGGALPGECLPTRLLALERPSPEALAAALRRAEPPVVGRVAEGALLLDPRTVLPGEDAALIEALAGVCR